MHQKNHGSTHHVFSLRRKLSTLMSCVFALACICLSWFFLEQHTSSRVQALQKQGLLLAEHLSRTGRYSVVSQDQIRLNQFIESTLQAEEIVYVIFTDQQGHILASGTKGMLLNQRSFTRTPSESLFPSQIIAETILDSERPQLTITPVRFANGQQEVLSANHGKVGRVETTFFIQNSETVFDFVVPIFRNTPLASSRSNSTFSLNQETNPKSSDLEPTPQLYGLVQIGLSDVYVQEDIRTMLWQVIVMTVGIIGLGVFVSILIATRITKPLHALTATAGRIMKGDFSARLPSTTDDEIGELTTTFNQMTQVLQERERTMSHHLEQLKTLSHSGTLVSSPMEVSAVFSSVVEVLTIHLGFSRAVAGLYEVDAHRLSQVHTKGFPENLSRALQNPELVVSDEQFLVAGLFCQAHLFLNQPVPADTWQFEYPLLRTASTFHVGLMDTKPLSRPSSILVFLAADKGPIQCQPFDLDLIRTLGNYLSIAIDKIFAYQHLATLNQTLESRVRDRTDELETANSKLKDLDRLKSTFVSMASHELRTPLTSIKMFVANMTDGIGGTLSQGHSEYLSRIRANVDRLQRMIADLLDITQIESGRMKLSFGTISLHDVAKEAVDNLRPHSQEKGVSIRLKSLDTLPLIEADHDKLFQILTNLFHNAVKFSASGDQVDVDVQLMDDEHIEVCVEDRGCGIDPQDLDNIFHPFFRSPKTSAHNPGAGLGLALSRQLVELHRGQLWVDSKPGKGSRFHLILPVKISPSPYAESQRAFR